MMSATWHGADELTELKLSCERKADLGLPIRKNLIGRFRYDTRPAKQHADTEAYHDNASKSFLPFDKAWVFT